MARPEADPRFLQSHSATAQRHTGGYAYLLVGVEPEALTGVTSLDNADLTGAIERYWIGMPSRFRGTPR